MKYFYFIGITLSGLTLGGCTSKVQTPRTALSIASVADITGTTASYTAPAGVPYGSVVLVLGTDFAAASICSGKSILGVGGTATCNADTRLGAVYLLSTAPRNAGVSPFPANVVYTTSSQLTVLLEVGTYGQVVGGLDLPSTGGYVYRDIPDRMLDDDGYTALTVRPAPRPATLCGASGDIDTRIADCTSLNPTTTPWTGSTQGHHGEATWSLVTNAGANQEVWKDGNTGLLWSSAAPAPTDWCQASGNTQFASVILTQAYNTAPGTAMTGNGTISAITGGTLSATETVTIDFTSPTTYNVTGATCTAGGVTGGLTGTPGDTETYDVPNVCSFTFTEGTTPFAVGDTFVLSSTDSSVSGCHAGGPLQPAAPVSFCAEGTGLNPGFGTDNWGTNTYDNAKGGMGATSTDKVRWRLPTLYDYQRADVDGIRNVMPDMGIAGTSRPVPDGSVAGNWEWTATTSSNTLVNAMAFRTGASQQADAAVTTLYNVRCVGR